MEKKDAIKSPAEKVILSIIKVDVGKDDPVLIVRSQSRFKNYHKGGRDVYYNS